MQTKERIETNEVREFRGFDAVCRMILGRVVADGWVAPYFLDVVDATGKKLIDNRKIWAGIGRNIACGDEPYFRMELAGSSWPITPHLEEAKRIPPDGGGLDPELIAYFRTLRWRKLDLPLSLETFDSFWSHYEMLCDAMRKTSINDERRREDPSARDSTPEDIERGLKSVHERIERDFPTENIPF